MISEGKKKGARSRKKKGSTGFPFSKRMCRKKVPRGSGFFKKQTGIPKDGSRRGCIS